MTIYPEVSEGAVEMEMEKGEESGRKCEIKSILGEIGMLSATPGLT